MNKSIKFGLKVVVIYTILMVFLLVILPGFFPNNYNRSWVPLFPAIATLISFFGCMVFILIKPIILVVGLMLNIPVLVMLFQNPYIEDRFGTIGGFALAGYLPSVLIYFLASFLIHKAITLKKLRKDKMEDTTI
jgi:hypothetical protein